MNLSSAQFISLLSTILKVAGTAIVAHGTLGINGAAWEQISGGILMLAPVIWDMVRHTDANTVIAAAAVKGAEVHVDPQVASEAVAAVAADPTQPKVVPK